MGKGGRQKTVLNEHAAGLSLSLKKKKIVIRDNMHTASLSINILKHRQHSQKVRILS